MKTLDARVLRRTLAVLEFDRGRSVAKIADMLAVTRQSAYNWIDTYTQNHDPLALQDEEGRGRRLSLDEDDEHLLEALLAISPQDLGYPHVNWTVPLLQEVLQTATEKRPSDNTLRGALHRMGYVWKRPRYDFVPDPEREKKNAEFAGKSELCRGAAWCWRRMRRTCCSSRRCAPVGRSGARRPGFG